MEGCCVFRCLTFYHIRVIVITHVMKTSLWDWHCIVCESTAHRSSRPNTMTTVSYHTPQKATHICSKCWLILNAKVSTMMISSLSFLSGELLGRVCNLSENLQKSHRTISLLEKCGKTLQNCQHWNFQSKKRIAVLLNLNIFLSPVARCTIFLLVVPKPLNS